MKTKDEIAEAYSSPTWWYDLRGFLILTLAYRSTLRRQVDFFGQNLAHPHLEVAIGSGTLVSFIFKSRKRRSLPPPDVTGIDYAPAMLDGAITRFKGVAGIELMQADVADLPFENGKYSSINIANAIHCFPDVDAALTEVYRVARNEARLSVNVLLYPRGPLILRWIAQKIDDWGIRKGILFTPYEEDDIKARIQAAGFEITFEEVRGNTLNLTARKPSA